MIATFQAWIDALADANCWADDAEKAHWAEGRWVVPECKRKGMEAWDGLCAEHAAEIRGDAMSEGSGG